MPRGVSIERKSWTPERELLVYTITCLEEWISTYPELRRNPVFRDVRKIKFAHGSESKWGKSLFGKRGTMCPVHLYIHSNNHWYLHQDWPDWDAKDGYLWSKCYFGCFHGNQRDNKLHLPPGMLCFIYFFGGASAAVLTGVPVTAVCSLAIQVPKILVKYFTDMSRRRQKFGCLNTVTMNISPPVGSTVSGS